MKARYLAPICFSVVFIALFGLLYIWSRSLREDIIAEQKAVNVPNETALVTSAEANDSVTGPMDLNAEHLELVHRENSKNPYLLKVRGQKPEVLFVANQLLAVPEDENVANKMKIWADGQDWISAKAITDSVILFTWEGHSAERFVEVRDLLEKVFGAGAVLEPNMIMQAMTLPDKSS